MPKGGGTILEMFQKMGAEGGSFCKKNRWGVENGEVGKLREKE